MEDKYGKLLKKSGAYRLFDADIPDSFAQTYLITSDDRVGIEELLTLIAMKVYCKNGGCGVCTICRRILSDNVIDLRSVNPEGTPIKVDEINEIIEDAAMSSFEGMPKVYIIRNIDGCNEIVQNKLLKTLEEPQKGVHFILTTSHPSGVLSTIKSRSRQVYLSPFKKDDLSEALVGAGYPQQDVQEMVGSAEGSLTIAEKFLADDNYFEISHTLLRFLCTLSYDNMVEYTKMSCFTQKQIPETLDFLEMIFQDVMKFGTGIELSFARYSEDLKILKNRMSNRVTACLNAVSAARKMLKANCVSDGVVHLLLMNIMEVIECK